MTEYESYVPLLRRLPEARSRRRRKYFCMNYGSGCRKKSGGNCQKVYNETNYFNSAAAFLQQLNPVFFTLRNRFFRPQRGLHFTDMSFPKKKHTDS